MLLHSEYHQLQESSSFCLLYVSADEINSYSISVHVDMHKESIYAVHAEAYISGNCENSSTLSPLLFNSRISMLCTSCSLPLLLTLLLLLPL
jgi:hypothetical protein